MKKRVVRLRLVPIVRDLNPTVLCWNTGLPFPWNDDERRHLRARLDALYFHLYGLSRDAAGYVLDTFLSARREDEKAFGHYRTRDMILAYMNAFGRWGCGDAGGGVETRKLAKP